MSLLHNTIVSNKHCVTKWEKELLTHSTVPLTDYRLSGIITGIEGKIERLEEVRDDTQAQDVFDQRDINDADDMIDILNTLLAQASSYQKSSSSTASSIQKTNVSLPKITIEPFFGDIYQF